MAKACPKCNRPNADQALKCVYCAAPFADAPPPAAAEPKAPGQGAPAAKRPAPAAARPEPPESFLVVQSPVENFEPSHLLTYCRLTGFDRYLAGQRLKSAAPWTVRAFREIEPAQAFLSQLAGLGLDAYLLKQSGIRKLEGKLNVHGLKSGEGGVVLLTEEGQEIPVKEQELFLIVRGRIERKPVREDEEENPVEVSLGGVIVGVAEPEENPDDPLVRLKQQARLIKLKRKQRPPQFYRRQSAEVMDLYLSTSHVGVRVIENEMDYSGLGERKQNAALLNFTAIFRELTARAPQAVVDDHFNRISYTVEEVAEKDKTRRLLEEIGVTSGARKLSDNEAAFTDYSTRIYLHHLRRAQLKKTAAP